ncbi:hypothetical protein Dsin_026392 [Dipteronia sinensis]|uniref:Uncharacterized protein n=1 Tax=Dipteronia sinensis TaxID=43782 RepID=A0AAD9ZXI7_9ROSI|nr:hypothetical protein Dsin_026392 [Dipteronia sinensis]
MASTTTTVDSSLWWHPFTDFLSELETASLSSDLSPNLVKKLEENRAWFVETVSRFKPPNEKSKEALNSQIVKVGSHQLLINSEFKDEALKISSYLCLDEVQSYILVERQRDQHNVAFDSIVQESLHAILLQYYIERQCLLKSTRRILMHALYIGKSLEEKNVIMEEALKLISDGLESKLISVLHDLLSATHPKDMDIDLFTLWAEETLIEDNLVLDILLLVYYESFSICNGEKWKKLYSLYKGIVSGSYNFGKLAISNDALKSSYDAKNQLLLILIETLDLENLLQMVHDETPFRTGALAFSSIDVQEMDALLSTFNAFEMKEAGPLILAWAVFLCLISSLPGREENRVLMEIDHVGYVRQAFEAASLSYFLEILHSDLLEESDGPVAGYRSVLRTFISAFIAAYEINLQLEDGTLNLILDILCKIYHGEESLCIQFWDKESFVDGPIRCFLCNLEGEFPTRTVELVRLLSSLCEGSWPAECVYNFLDRSVGISTLFEITSDSVVDGISQIVETLHPLHVPGVDGLLIPSKTRGHVLKVLGGNTALVRWEYTQSAVLVLLLRLAQERYPDSSGEALLTLDLLSRMVSSGMATCFALMGVGNSFYVQETSLNGHMEKNVWMVEIICTLIRNLSPNSSSAAAMSMGVNILAKMLKCSPTCVSAVALKANIFDVASMDGIFDVSCNGSSSGWFLSGKLAKMLLVDCEQNDYDCPLVISVLDFTLELVKTGLENNFVLALVVFSLQYILVNHEYWKYKVKHVRWKVTLKVLEVMKTCIISTSSSGNQVIQGILLCDPSIHNTLFRIICTNTDALEKLYLLRNVELMEIEGLQLAISSVLEILYIMLSKFSKELSSGLPIFHQAVLSSTTTPISVVGAVTSLTSYFNNSAIQVGATRVLSMLLTISDYAQSYLSANACFGLEDKQIADLSNSVECMLRSVEDEDLFVASVNLLTSAAQYQPAFLIALFAIKESKDVQPSNGTDMKHPTKEASLVPQESKKSSLLDALLLYVERSDDLINSNPRILLNVLNFFKAIWQGTGQYTNILEWLKSLGKFWKQLSNSFSLTTSLRSPPFDNMTEKEALSLAYKCQCQSTILEIMAHDMFLQKKLLHAELLVKQATESKGRIENSVSAEQSKSAKDSDLKDILSSWCESSVLSSLIKSYASCVYENEIHFRAKVAVSLFTVHMMEKLATGDEGCLSISLLEKIRIMYKKLTSQAAFAQLSVQYSQHGYSEGKELKTLILNDLYCHLRGELEGRQISPGPFKELSQYLIESKFLQSYKHKHDGDLFTTAKNVYLFDPVCVQADLGLDVWDYSEWKASKATADIMLHSMQDVNSMVLLGTSKLSALKALVSVLTVYEDDVSSLDSEHLVFQSVLEKRTTIGGKIPDELTFSCIDLTCQSINTTVEYLAPALDASEDILDFLAAQTELLLHLLRSVRKSLSIPICVHVLKTSRSGLKVLSDLRSLVTGVKITRKHLLLLLLLVVEFTCGVTDMKSIEDFAEVSNLVLGLLPILCHCITSDEHCTLSLTTVDLILRSLLTPDTWFPIVQQHLQLQLVIRKLQDKNSFASIPIILKFFLTLALVRGGAEMLCNAGFFSSLRVLFADLLDGRHSSVVSNDKSVNALDKTEKLQHIWGLGLAVVAAMVHSLGENYCKDIVDNVIPYFFSEKAYLISYYLNAPEFPSDSHDKKRPRAQRAQTSLTSLKETEHTLMLMCVLVKHWNSWEKATKEMDSQLRETSIHLLAFISRGTQRLGESSSRVAPLLCPPILKEELDWCKKPSDINSKNGWFAVSPLGCESKPKLSAVSTTAAFIIRDQATEKSRPISQTHFSDAVAMQLYRIAFLLLKFLCSQAEGAAKRAEEVGFVDLAHFPELPMPEILHGLQDQALAIVIELCEASKLKQTNPEIQGICLLLLQIMEMALNLELCVLQICGIRPVLGRVEDFSKGVKLLIKATEGHAFLKVSMRSLKQIISIVYPGLL